MENPISEALVRRGAAYVYCNQPQGDQHHPATVTVHTTAEGADGTSHDFALVACDIPLEYKEEPSHPLMEYFALGPQVARACAGLEFPVCLTTIFTFRDAEEGARSRAWQLCVDAQGAAVTYEAWRAARVRFAVL